MPAQIIRGKSDPLQDLQCCGTLLLPRQTTADTERLCHRVLHCESGIERGAGILKYLLHTASLAPKSLFVMHIQKFAVKFDATAGRFQKAESSVGEGGFSTSGFSHQSEGLPLVYLNGDVGHSVEKPTLRKDRLPFDGKSHIQMFGAKKYLRNRSHPHSV